MLEQKMLAAKSILSESVLTFFSTEISRAPKSKLVAYLLLIFVFGFGAHSVFLSTPAWAAEFHAQVIRVLDGDTIEVLHDGKPERIRLNGLDCPEKSQAFGNTAKQFTSELCFGKVVAVDDRGHDRFGRTIGEVTLPDGRDLNHELVRTGLAWWYRKYAPRDSGLQQLEEQARKNKSGLWSDPDPVPPWDFRKVRRGPTSISPHVRS